MTTLLCRIKVKANQADAFAAMQRQMAAGSWQEEHCRTYETFRSANQDEFYVLMSFDQHRGFIEHQLTPLHRNAPWGDLLEEVEMIYLDPVGGASTLSPSVPQILDKLDADTEAYLQPYAYERAAWWPDPVRA